MLDRILAKNLLAIDDKITLIASQRERKKQKNDNFAAHILSNITSKHNIDLEIIIKTPSQIKALQAVDFISWAVFQKYENNNEIYYNLIKDIIVEEENLFEYQNK